MEVSEAKRLKALKEDNRKLKTLLAEQVMDVVLEARFLSDATLKEMLGKNF